MLLLMRIIFIPAVIMKVPFLEDICCIHPACIPSDILVWNHGNALLYRMLAAANASYGWINTAIHTEFRIFCLSEKMSRGLLLCVPHICLIA